jgi:aryl-alcohol dehydrogenase-like predicted oxidoreductase
MRRYHARFTSFPELSMKRRTLGPDGPEVSALGLGCMGMSGMYGTHDDAASIAVIQHALDQGLDFLDTADVYGPHSNEQLVGKAIGDRREDAFVATKFGFMRGADASAPMRINGRPDYVRSSCEASLKRLGLDHIDLYYLHRVDPDTPIEETVGAMADLVRQGKVRFVGLSEPSAATLRRAHAEHPVTAIQCEYSLWTRDPEDGVLDTCRELGVGFVPYSPLGRGFLSGAIRSPEDFPEDDYRRNSPRFQGENFKRNLALVDKVGELAADKGCTPAQLALAWVLGRDPHIVPIPGTKRIRYLDQNIGALDVELDATDLKAIDAVFPPDAASGARYTEPMMSLLRG